MAMYDWDGDGNKDGFDDYIEYEIINGSSDDGRQYSSRPKNGEVSTIGAILYVIGGLVLEAVFFTALGVDIENVSVIILVILWPVCIIVLYAAVNIIRSKLH